MAADQVHFVRVDRRRRLRSETLPADTVQRLESEYRAGHWFLDRWTRRRFRVAAARTMQTEAEGGLVLLGPRFDFEVPPPFTELFEPIPLSSGIGRQAAQLQTLTGPEPTRQERKNIVVNRLLDAIAGLIVLGLLFGPFPRSQRILLLLAANGAIAALVAALIVWLRRIRGRWFLLPAAVAIVGGIGRPPGALIRLTRFDAFAVLRKVHTGKATVLVLELVSITGRGYRHAVTDREAISFLAAWQSPRPPPSLEELRELPGVSRAALPGN